MWPPLGSGGAGGISEASPSPRDAGGLLCPSRGGLVGRPTGLSSVSLVTGAQTVRPSALSLPPGLPNCAVSLLLCLASQSPPLQKGSGPGPLRPRSLNFHNTPSPCSRVWALKPERPRQRLLWTLGRKGGQSLGDRVWPGLAPESLSTLPQGLPSSRAAPARPEPTFHFLSWNDVLSPGFPLRPR